MASWIDVPYNKYCYGRTIIAYSDTGLIKRLDGTIEESNYRTRICGERIYRLIANNFLISVHSNEQRFVDHITHNPVDMNINDVRNLRWCTIKENNNFEECRLNKSNSKKGKSAWNKGMKGAVYTKHYKNGIKNQFTCTEEG